MAVVWTLLASEPACSSVRAKAASFSPRARGGSQRAFCSGVPKSTQGPDADRMVGVDEHGRRRAMAADHLHDPAVAHLREPPAAPLRGRGHAQHAELGQPVDDRARDVGLAVDRGGVDLASRRTRAPRRRPPRPSAARLGQLGVGKERLAAKLAPKERLGKPGSFRPREQQLFRLLDLLGPQSRVGRLRRARSGDEVVTAMATDSFLVVANRTG